MYNPTPAEVPAEYYLLFYVTMYYFIGSFSLILRCFFQLFVNRERVTKADFVLSIFWPVMVWLVPTSFILDLRTLADLRNNEIDQA